MRYYRLTENMDILGKWYLGEINNISYAKQWGFTMKSLFYLNETLEIPIKITGKKTDFTENLTYNIPIISNKLKLIVEKHEVSLSKIKLENDIINKDNYYYALGTKIIDCVDNDRSTYIKYKADDPIRPDKVGDYKFFEKLVLSKEKISINQIFRIKGYTIYLIVSENIKNEIESVDLTGCSFKEVEVH